MDGPVNDKAKPALQVIILVSVRWFPSNNCSLRNELYP